MPQLIQHIDAIGRARKRDVLMVAPDCHGMQGEAGRNWMRSGARQELIDWLDANEIGWEPCGWPPAQGCVVSYQGALYIDLAYDPAALPCASFIAYVQEDAQGFLKWPGIRLYLCTVDWAQQFAHHDQPGYWTEQARDW